ncbi:DUF6344 domain-containing protein [Streptomyces sp. NPDC002888]|uniref:DUF6344 domain-containing protein n=1 Tax=Streptomyces sp. NPDC002888 TaxID=3364668 RepID=UPI0036936B68
MAQNHVMKLWTAIVTAFLALCTTLGLVTTTATAAVQETGTARNSDDSTAHVTPPAMTPWAWSHNRALPPTMKQRIRAEAHGKSPGCRHRPLSDTAEATTPATQPACDETPPRPAIPLQR